MIAEQNITPHEPWLDGITHLDSIPDTLKSLAQWVNVGLRRRAGEEKKTKVPFDPKDTNCFMEAAATRPDSWGTFPQAREGVISTRRFANKFPTDGDTGLPTFSYQTAGFVLTAKDPFTVVDLDDSRDPETGEVAEWAMQIVCMLNSWTEISVSGKGLHVFTLAALPPGNRKKGDIEAYDDKRFIAMTGNHLPGTPLIVEPRQAEVERFHAEYLGSGNQKSGGDNTQVASSEGSHPRSQASPIPDDASLLGIARAAKNGDKFKRLYDKGDLDDYDGDKSEADMALVSRLSFYCGPDPDRIERLMRCSALVRDKWDSMRGDVTWIRYTIERHLEDRTEFYTPRNSDDTGDGEANRTDLGNAKRLIRAFGDDLRYLPAWKTWLCYDGKRWMRDDTGAVRRKAHETIRMIFGDATRMEDEERERWTKFALRSEAEARIGAMINEARWLKGVAITPAELDADPYLLNVLNGTLDLRTGTLLPHDRKHLMTKIAPVSYDPAARCPLWSAFLDRVQPEAETRDFLRRGAGYSLTGITTSQAFFFLYGGGQNGKSVYIDILSELLGMSDDGYWGKTKAETLMHIGKPQGGANNDLADLFGKRLISVAEMDEGMRLNEGLIKDLTGDEAVTARQLYEKNVTWKPTFKLWFYGNHRPEIRGTDGGIRRRPKMIPFTVRIPDDEKDENLKDKLKGELSGILNWALSGCLEWQRDGLGSAPQVEEATQQYLADMDVIGTFLEECCEKSTSETIPASTFYQVYTAWARLNNEYVKTNKKFGMSLTERGYTKKRLNSGNFYEGVALTAEGQKLVVRFSDGSY